MNSFRSVERAITYEIERQAAILDAGGTLVMETRGWADDRGETYRMRAKETSDDYRYFPEPDLPAAPPRSGLACRADATALPELPSARRDRYRTTLGLSAYDAAVLVADPDATRLFEATLAAGAGLGPEGRRDVGHRGVPQDPERGVRHRSWWSRPSSPRSSGPSPTVRSPARMAARSSRRTSPTAASAAAIVAERGFAQISDAGALDALIDEVFAANPAADRGLSRRQAPGRRVPRRPGHEGHPAARPTRRWSRPPSGRAWTATTGGLTSGAA